MPDSDNLSSIRQKPIPNHANDMFAFNTKKPPRNYKTFDECLDHSQENDLFPIADLIRGQSLNKAKRVKKTHLRPTAMIRFNTRLGKAKAVTIVALLDSGGAESLVTEQLTSKLRVRCTEGPPKIWGTPNGDLATTKKVKSQFTLPELHEDKLIEWDFHVTKTLGAYDMIIGRDLLDHITHLI